MNEKILRLKNYYRQLLNFYKSNEYISKGNRKRILSELYAVKSYIFKFEIKNTKKP